MDTYAPVHRKIMSVREAQGVCDTTRLIGGKIALCNGCFDGFLTPGHLSVFEHAARHADLVIAAVNSDASVAKLKGEDRPFLPLTQRQWMLASLSTVNLVVEMESDGPVGLVALLSPHYLVKGSDTPIEDAIAPGIGSVALTGMDCEVIFAPEMAGPHTSEILAKIS